MKSALFGPRQNHTLGKNPILVIDREGLIGESLSLKLSKEFSVVFVSRSSSANVPFSKKIPEIPDNKYSHIIFIDEEGRDLEFLPKIIRKAKDVNSDFIFVQGLSSGGKYVTDKIFKLYPSSKTVIFGDIFDDKLIVKKDNHKSIINRFIYQAQRFGKIQILGDGLRETYPVFLGDVVGGLIDIVFGIHRNNSLFYLFPKHPVTELSLAHMIQKINPEITIDFTKYDPRVRNIAYPIGGINLLGDKYPLTQKIRGIDMKKNISSGEKEKYEDLDRDTKRPKSFPFFIIWGLISLLISPFVFTMLFSSLGLNSLYYANREIDKGNFVNVKSSAHLSRTFFYLGEQTLKTLSFQTKIIGKENNLKGLSQDLDSGYKISDGILQAFNSGDYFSKILDGKSENPKNDLAKRASFLKSSIVALDKAKAEQKIPAPISQKLESISPLIKFLSSTPDVMPGILGMDGEKTYLILFQDNTELRPGGGLINSYGILKFNMGKITEFTIHDVFDADEQLRGHVEPPFALRRYLPKQHWYMKDSNFDIDFVQSALSASKFLTIETGQKADGVIGVDASLMKKLKELKTSYFLIAKEISDALLQKNLMFAFNNSLQNIFTANNWSSSLWDERIDRGESINDFVGINEANLGMNKVNNFIKRQIDQTVKIEPDGSLLGELGLNYKNNSASLQDGNYKNYLRIILPLNTSISSILINDIPQSMVDAVTNPLIYEAKNFKAPSGLEVEKSIGGQKAIYGFLVNVPAKELIKIKIQYTVLGKSAFNSNNFSYSLKIFKQPGIGTLPYSFILYYPDNLNVVSAVGLRREDNSLSHSDNITEDKELKVSFAAK